MRYALLSSVTPPVLPLHHQLRYLSHQMRAPQSIARLPLSGFNSAISPQSVACSRVAAVIQGASYLQVLSLKFSEGVCKTLTQSVGHATATGSLNGRLHSNRPRTRVRITYCSVSGSFSGIMLLVISILAASSELRVLQDNPHLRKAALRPLQRPMRPLCFVD
jgi:hypothetical protein